MIEEELLDFIRVSVTYAGGISHVRRIVDLADLHNIRTGFHGAPSHSPLSMAAQAHLNAWAPNFGIQEYLVLGTPECDALFPSEHKLKTACSMSATRPASAWISTNHEAKKYSFDRRYHPIVRLEDGTMWNY